MDISMPLKKPTRIGLVPVLKIISNPFNLLLSLLIFFDKIAETQRCSRLYNSIANPAPPWYMENNYPLGRNYMMILLYKLVDFITIMISLVCSSFRQVACSHGN